MALSGAELQASSSLPSQVITRECFSLHKTSEHLRSPPALAWSNRETLRSGVPRVTGSSSEVDASSMMTSPSTPMST